MKTNTQIQCASSSLCMQLSQLPKRLQEAAFKTLLSRPASKYPHHVTSDPSRAFCSYPCARTGLPQRTHAVRVAVAGALPWVLPACCPEVPSISGGYFSVSLTLLFAPLLFRFPHFPREMPIASMLSSSTYTSTDLHIYWHVSMWMSMGTSKSMHPTHTHRHFAKGISPPGVRTW